MIIPTGTSAPSPNIAVGTIRFNTTSNHVEMFDGNAWQQLAGTVKPSKYVLIDPTVDRLPAPKAGYYVVDVGTEVMLWVSNEMPVHMWKYDTIPAYSSSMERIIVSDKLLMLMRLKFAE